MNDAGRQLFRGHSATDICGAWMKWAQEPCARRKGHGRNGHSADHRTRAALDYARDSARIARNGRGLKERLTPWP